MLQVGDKVIFREDLKKTNIRLNFWTVELVSSNDMISLKNIEHYNFNAKILIKIDDLFE